MSESDFINFLTQKFITYICICQYTLELSCLVCTEINLSPQHGEKIGVCFGRPIFVPSNTASFQWYFHKILYLFFTHLTEDLLSPTFIYIRMKALRLITIIVCGTLGRWCRQNHFKNHQTSTKSCDSFSAWFCLPCDQLHPHKIDALKMTITFGM